MSKGKKKSTLNNKKIVKNKHILVETKQTPSISKWQEAGFSKEDEQFFKEEGISLKQAKKMKKTKKTAPKEKNNWKDSGFTKKDSQYYIKTNTSVTEAKKWKAAGFRGKDAYYYIHKGISLNEAIERLK